MRVGSLFGFAVMSGLVAVLSFGSGAARAQQSVELCLALDGSGSINSSDFGLQLEGYAVAIENAAVVPRNSTVAVSVVQFSTSATTEISEVLIDSAATAQTLASDIRAISQNGGGTNAGAAIDECVNAISPQRSGFQQVIDLSTDGSFPDATANADAAVAAGVDAINALGVGSGVRVTQLEATVRPQPASAPPSRGFVVTVDGFDEFEPTIAAKIQAEVSGGSAGTEPVPALPFAAFFGLVLGIIAIARRQLSRTFASKSAPGEGS